jgi:Tol biopolymer transport system component
MRKNRDHVRHHHLFAAAVLALALAGGVPSGARAAFPGKPGPIFYFHSQSGPTWSYPGIFAHGPRQTQTPRQLAPVRSSSTIATSADGHQIAFSTIPAESTASHLFIMAADGSGLRQLTSGPFYDSHPSFSPDGTRIVFQRAVETNPDFDIYSVGTEGSGLQRLTDGPAGDFEPTFTPSGRRIVFVSDRSASAGNPSAIYAMGPGGDHIRALADSPGTESAPDVSPSGRRIVFLGGAGRHHGIFIARANGRDPHLLSKRISCERGYCLEAPVWSADEKHFAALQVFEEGGGFRSFALVVIRANGSRLPKKFASAHLDEATGSLIGPPAWAPAPPR